MNKKFNYKFDLSNGILYKYYYGEIHIQDISASWEYAFENNLLLENPKGYILDYRGATFAFKIKDHVQIANFYRENLKYFGNKRIAIITDNPKDIVIPSLVELKDDGYSSKPFSTLDAAIAWVLS